MTGSLVNQSIRAARRFARRTLPDPARKTLGATAARAFQSLVRPALGMAFDLFYKRYRSGGCSFEVPRDQTTRNFRACFFLDDYENEERELIARHLRPTDHVLEYGACIGVVSCTTNRLLSPSSRHAVVEGNPLLISTIAKNKVLNRSSFILENGAASPSAEYVDFHIHPEFIVGGCTRDVGPTTFRVQGLPLSEMRRRHGRFDVLILDIEGSELDFLKGCQQELADFRLVILELHPFAYGPEGAEACRRVLSEAGFARIDAAGDTEAWSRS